MSLPPPPGIYVPVPTFFHPPTSTVSRSLNLPLQSQHSLHLANSGIRGLVLAGSTGEAVHLTRTERFSLISSQRDALTNAGFKDYPIIAGVASDSIDDALVELTSAQEAGAQFGMVLVPNYFAAAAGTSKERFLEGVIRWFKEVADKSPIPILIYHYPGVSNNVSLPVSTYISLASHPNIVGCKLSHGNVPVHLQLAHLSLSNPSINFHVFSGLGQQLFPLIAGGCHGAIDGLAGVFPKTLVYLFNLSWEFFNDLEVSGRKEKLDKLRSLQVLVSKAEEFVELEGTVGIKHAIGMEVFKGVGVKEGGFEGRPPLQGGLSEEIYRKWNEGVFVHMQELEESL